MPRTNTKSQRNKQSAKTKGRKKNNGIGVVVTAATSAMKKAINSRPVRKATGSVKMSSCAGKLAAAIADPFSEEARGACFPLYPAPDSHKVTAHARIEGAIGSAGYGFVALSPSLANNTPSGYVTGSTFASSNMLIMTATSTYNTGCTPFYHNGPYTASQFIRTDAVAETVLTGRIVSVGIRITYTGTTLNESGTVTLFSHPVHSNITGASAADLQSFASCQICPFTRKPCVLSTTPAAVGESSYPAVAEAGNTRLLYPFNADGHFNSLITGGVSWYNLQTIDTVSVALGTPHAAIMVTGVAGSTFHVDMVYHLEYTGRDCAASATPNAVDVSSTYAILTAAHQLTTRRMADPTASSWKLLMDGIRSAMGSPVAVTARGLMGLKL